MLATQVEYWKLMETKRHNLEAERQGGVSLEISKHQAESSRMQAQAAERQATAAERTASANLQNAATNARNAETNAYNASINARNAATNERNAQTNERNAETNAGNLAVNEYRAVIEQQNANTREYEAVSGRIQAQAASKQATAANVQANVAAYNAETNRKEYERKQYETDFNTTGAGFALKVDLKNIEDRKATAAMNQSNAAFINSGANTTKSNAESRYTIEYKALNTQADTKLKQAQISKTKAETMEKNLNVVEKGWSLIKDIGKGLKEAVTTTRNNLIMRKYTAK